ncbi:hypothetical protein [Rhizobium leguminosarum]|uniref:hypothetical protein n=1 Tax=Rhizobium leguminosarum TaxID=384 RepID=UPI0013EE5899|nr:hypothetical protein [Rhizobium leguminosarum]
MIERRTSHPAADIIRKKNPWPAQRQLSREEADVIAEGLRDGIEASCCSFAQQGFEFRKGHVDGIEVGE